MLIEQVVDLLDHLDYDKLKMQSSFEGELRRFNKFQRAVLGEDAAATHKDADLKTYAKYILRKGTNAEKRQLMGHFKTRLKIIRKVVRLRDLDTFRTPYWAEICKEMQWLAAIKTPAFA